MRGSSIAAAASLLSASVSASPHGSLSHGSLPVVDLGYELHQASKYNTTGRYYTFSDIRYAAPPTGENRFKAPQPPARNRSAVQTGGENRVCPQANPAWVGAIAPVFLPEYLAGQTSFNASSFNVSIPGVTPGTPSVTINSSTAGALSNAFSSLIPPDVPGTTEDCLFLDVVVPQNIFNNKKKGKGAPVLVWIYGGGYTAGQKSGGTTNPYDPSGLLAHSENNGGEGVVYVALNYRLGAFGWLSGPTFQQNGTANAGLYDQRFALEWVQNNIEKFGGDKSRVTVFGESAGGGSIEHQITAFGGKEGKAPFQQAITQSPGFQPIVSNQQQEQTFKAYLALLNVTTLEEARQLPYKTLQRANAVQVGLAPYGSFTYGPVVDGNFAPALPGLLLQRGQYDTSLRVMVGHNADEGLLFTSPFINDTASFEKYYSTTIPTVRAWPQVMQYIDSIYPISAFPNQIARAVKLVSEVIFTCNTFYLDKAYGNNTYSYEFAVPPAIHGQDVAYTFFTGVNATGVNTTIATALQEYITSFAMNKGNPNENGVPHFQMYGPNASIELLNVTGIRQAHDDTANARCDWWQEALYV